MHLWVCIYVLYGVCEYKIIIVIIMSSFASPLKHRSLFFLHHLFGDDIVSLMTLWHWWVSRKTHPSCLKYNIKFIPLCLGYVLITHSLCLKYDVKIICCCLRHDGCSHGCAFRWLVYDRKGLAPLESYFCRMTSNINILLLLLTWIVPMFKQWKFQSRKQFIHKFMRSFPHLLTVSLNLIRPCKLMHCLFS